MCLSLFPDQKKKKYSDLFNSYGAWLRTALDTNLLILSTGNEHKDSEKLSKHLSSYSLVFIQKKITKEITMFTLEWNLMNTSYEVFEEMTQGHFVITIDYGFVCVRIWMVSHKSRAAFQRVLTTFYTFGRWFCQCVCSLWNKPIVLVSTNWASDVSISSEL